MYENLVLVQVLVDEGKDYLLPAGDVRDATEDGNHILVHVRSGGEPVRVRGTTAALKAKIDAALESLQAQGVKRPITTKTAAYTATADDHTILCDATAAALTVTLPPAATNARQILVIKKIDSSGNTVTVDGSGSELIDGAATKSLATQWTTLMIQSDGVNWYILAAGATA